MPRARSAFAGSTSRKREEGAQGRLRRGAFAGPAPGRTARSCHAGRRGAGASRIRRREGWGSFSCALACLARQGTGRALRPAADNACHGPRACRGHRPQVRQRFYTSAKAPQKDLNQWLEFYSHEWPHQGNRNMGKRPTDTIQGFAKLSAKKPS